MHAYIHTEFWHGTLDETLIGLTQSDLMTSLSHGTADWISPISVANELTAQHSNIRLALTVAVCNPPPSPAPPVYICYEMIHGCYGGYFMYVVFAAAVFLTCSQQHDVDVLAVASLGTCSATAAAA